MDVIVIIMLSGMIALTALLVFYAIHAMVVCWQHSRVLNAIIVYVADTVMNHHKRLLVSVDDVESVDTITNNVWDWGYKNFLPPDKLAIIEPYIQMVTGACEIEKILKGHTISSIDDIAKILRGGIEPMESKNISNTQKVTSFDDIIPINDRPEPMDKMDKFDPDHKV